MQKPSLMKMPARFWICGSSRPEHIAIFCVTAEPSSFWNLMSARTKKRNFTRLFKPGVGFRPRLLPKSFSGLDMTINSLLIWRNCRPPRLTAHPCCWPFPVGYAALCCSAWEFLNFSASLRQKREAGSLFWQ